MIKTIRNIIFACICLVMTGIGLEWNHTVLDNHLAAQPVNRAVVAAESQVKEAIPLEVVSYFQLLRLGRTQKITVTTSPGAKIRVRVVPERDTGVELIEKHAVASGDGVASLEIKIDDYRFVGRAIVAVLSESERKTATKSFSFSVESWSEGVFDLGSGSDRAYSYPLIP